VTFFRWGSGFPGLVKKKMAFSVRHEGAMELLGFAVDVRTGGDW